MSVVGVPEVSVRSAVPGDEQRIAQIQLACWRAGVLDAAVIAQLDPERITEAWRQAVTAPPAGHHVLVALAGAQIVGFTAVVPPDVPADDAQPSDDPATGLVVTLEVEPTARRAGHGSRLLQAAVDHLRAADATVVSLWVLHGDEARIRFLGEAGLRPDGAQRRLTDATDPLDRDLVESRWSALV